MCAHIELLAPAGSPESFYAALDAGADAIYLGLNEFNARLRASNFSIKTLSYLVPYTHKQGKKIYVTLNTLIKQSELEKVINLLYQLEQLGVDAVIIQDIGLAHIAQRHFPTLGLHASTQMVIHNSAGVKAADRIGFKRVILARELSIKEIEEIQKKMPATELEVFIHGALCYSISGLCLASSYLGGLSGNRGRCTQVCRRYYSTGKSAGFYFSPKDLCALDFIEDYKRIGISSIKIEGRMRSAQYVHTVVSAYRKALDNTASIASIKYDLHLDLGREKTTLFLNKNNPKEVINTSNPSGTGHLIGTVQDKTNSNFKIKSNEKLLTGDKIRLHSQHGLEGKSIKINKLSFRSGLYTIVTDMVSHVGNGDYVYLISRGTSNLKKREKQTNIKPILFRKTRPFTKKILKRHTNSKKTKKARSTLYLKFNSIEWFSLAKPDICKGFILQCGKKDIQNIVRNNRLLNKWIKSVIIALPPFIHEKDIPFWKRNIKGLHKAGITRWMCTHIGQKDLIPQNCRVYTDTSTWCTNMATQHSLKKEGFNNFSYSIEDDILNLKATGNAKGFFILFSYIPLFISRIKPPVC
jgi:putative protease